MTKSRCAIPAIFAPKATSGELRLLLLVLALVSAPALAETTDDTEVRPRIGLALSGGGARGCAHVGVLKVLEELRIPVDYIAGTSMGAIVGGLYSTGLSATEVEEILTTMDWEAMSEDRPPRRQRSYRRKQDDQRYVMNLEIGLDGFVFPSGLRSGQRFTFELRRHTLPVVGIEDFEELPVSFKAVAVDLETGERVLLDHGDLAQAMRASMSIPGVFTPVEIDGRLLVDGGIVANLPIDVVREMGADVVIAVDIGDQLVGREELDSLFAVTSQSMTISSAQNVKALLPLADLLLAPHVSNYGTLDFASVAEIIDAGVAETRRHAGSLESLTVSESEFARHQETMRIPASTPRVVSRIEMRGLRRVDERVVRRAMRTRTGEPLNLAILGRDLGRVYGLGDFSLVDYEVEIDAGALILVVVVQEKKGGPFFLRNAVNLDFDNDQNSSASVLLNVTAIRLNALGAEWSTDLSVGSVQRIETEFYQPLDFGGRWFVAPRIGQRRDIFTLYSENESLVEAEQIIGYGALDFGRTLATSGEIRVGMFRERRERTLKNGPATAGLPSTVDLGGYSARVNIDRLDSIYFPRSGQLGSLGVSFSRSALGADDEFELGHFAHVGVKSFGKHTLLSWIEFGGPLGDDQPPYAWFGGGGLFSFSAYRPGELFGSTFAVYRATYLYRMGRLPTIVGKGLYVGSWLEVGNYWLSRDDVGFDDLRYAATIILGAETVVGPLYLAFGLAEDGRRQIYLSVGPSFSNRPR